MAEEIQNEIDYQIGKKDKASYNRDLKVLEPELFVSGEGRAGKKSKEPLGADFEALKKEKNIREAKVPSPQMDEEQLETEALRIIAELVMENMKEEKEVKAEPEEGKYDSDFESEENEEQKTMSRIVKERSPSKIDLEDSRYDQIGKAVINEKIKDIIVSLMQENHFKESKLQEFPPIPKINKKCQLDSNTRISNEYFRIQP